MRLAVRAIAGLLLGSWVAAQGGAPDDARWRDLVRQLADRERRDSAIERMDRPGPPAVGRLIAGLEFTDGEATRAVLYALSELAHHGAEHYAELTARRAECPENVLAAFLHVEADFACFLDEAESTRARLAIRVAADFAMRGTEDDALRPALGSVYARCLRRGPSVEHGLGELVEFLDKNKTTRHAEDAARLLGRRGAGAKDAVEALLVTLRRPIRRLQTTIGTRNLKFTFHSGAEHHRYAARAITRIVPGTEAAAEAWGYLALEGTRHDFARAMQALRLAHETAARAMYSLGRALERDLPTADKAELITTLGILGSKARQTVGQLERIAAGEDRQLAAVARAALRSVNRD